MTVPDRVVMVRAMKNFDNHEVGDVFCTTMTESTAHLVVGGYLQLLEDPAWQHESDSTGPKSS